MLDFRNRRVTVMGLGRFGGGTGAVRFLCSRGARVTLTDLQSERALAASLGELGDCRLEAVYLGGHREEDFANADMVVASPAVPPNNRYLEIARASGACVTSEISLFWQLNPARVAGVTGSNGKSTTAAMLHAIFQAAAWKTRLGGNIGRSLLPEVDTIGPDEWIVLELSSFQLEELDRLQVSPQVAVVTNFSPNHLDRHGSVDAYRRAKQTIVRWQDVDDVAVLNADDSDVSTWPTRGRRVFFGGLAGASGLTNGRMTYRDGTRSVTLPIGEWCRLPGQHNLQNAAAAACAALAAGVDVSAVQAGLENFRALEHRLELVAEGAGRKFYNDSKATTPESMKVAVESLPGPIVLLAGGYDKRVDLKPMADSIASRAKSAALMGQTAERLRELLEREHGGSIPARVCRSLNDAFSWAVMKSEPGDSILLSPGCASYDWFRDYRERGERFTKLARDWCARH